MEPRKLTIEELRNCKGMESLTDLEVKEIIETIFQLSLITHDTISKKQRE